MITWETLKDYRKREISAVADRVADLTERFLTLELTRILSPVLKKRKVRFSDGMGAVDVVIPLRRGRGELIISSDDLYAVRTTRYFSAYWYYERPWVKEVKALLKEYEALSDRLFALEFNLFISGRTNGDS